MNMEVIDLDPSLDSSMESTFSVSINGNDLISMIIKLLLKNDSQEIIKNIDDYLAKLDKIVDEYHPHCLNCNAQIHGIYYSCSHCNQFTICEECEKISEQFHDYNFIKIKRRDKVFKNPLTEITQKFFADFACLLKNFNEDLKNYQQRKNSTIESVEKVDKVPAGSIIKKIWKVANRSNVDWNNNTELRYCSGNFPIKIKTIPICLKAGNEKEIVLNYEIPSNITEEKVFFANYQFFHNDQPFGNELKLEILALPKETNSVDSVRKIKKEKKIRKFRKESRKSKVKQSSDSECESFPITSSFDDLKKNTSTEKNNDLKHSESNGIIADNVDNIGINKHEQLELGIKKLFQMGFCNRSLSRWYLLKNKLDISQTIIDLHNQTLND